MKIQDFELELQAIDPELNIKPSPQAPDVCGVYYGAVYITAIPSGDIYPETNPSYQDAFGTPHKNSEIAKAQINRWLENKEQELKDEAEFQALQKRQYGR